MTDTVSAVIANGASQSGVINIRSFLVGALQMPAAWTAAVITFLASDSENGTFDPVYDDSGTEVSVTVAASRVVGLDAVAGSLAACQYLKLRSGTVGAAVNQGAERTIKVFLKGR